MRRFFSPKIMIAILSLFILTASMGLFVYASVEDDVIKIRKNCQNYCSKYTGLENYACMVGCIEGATI